MKQLDTTLFAQSKLLGAELYGVTDLDNVKNHTHSIPCELLDIYDKAISIGMIIPKSLCSQESANYSMQLFNYYLSKVIIPSVDRIALLLTSLVEKAGYKAQPLPANLHMFNEQHPFYFHALIGSYAGLGWLGKHNKLVNSLYGSRIQCVTILTDAELDVSEVVEDGCKQCFLCVENCPNNALTGMPFHPHHELDVRCKSDKCANSKALNNDGSTFLKCNMCIAICPYND